uniref:Uncharacterized protein n=1 Tax=Salix viminalis TaxID=40686 RepID=A0A6N2K178_SALVM
MAIAAMVTWPSTMPLIAFTTACPWVDRSWWVPVIRLLRLLWLLRLLGFFGLLRLLRLLRFFRLLRFLRLLRLLSNKHREAGYVGR